MDNLSDYDPRWCDGHFCQKDCDVCPYRAENREEDDAEYIERESAYPPAKRICDAIDSEEFQRLNFGLRILDWIDEVPAVDVRPVVRGKWKKAPCHETDEAYTYICPFCRWYMIAIEPMNFCPNCGADMREPPKEE